MIYWYGVALTFQLGLKQFLHRIYKDFKPFLPVLNIHNKLESTHKIMANKIYRWPKDGQSGESQQRQPGLVDAKCIQIQLNAKYVYG